MIMMIIMIMMMIIIIIIKIKIILISIHVFIRRTDPMTKGSSSRRAITNKILHGPSHRHGGLVVKASAS